MSKSDYHINMSESTVITVQDTLRAAFHALLQGDTAERDRLCKLAETAWEGDGLSQGMLIGDIPANTPVKTNREGLASYTG